MPLLNKREFQKKLPWRDATIFIIVCEGSNREPDYFEFFDRLTSQIKIIAVPSKEGKSSPNHLIFNAEESIRKHNSDQGDFELWFVVDLDKWLEHNHLYELQSEAKSKNWKVVISNPCFEVWLNNHFSNNPPDVDLEKCRSWKKHVHDKFGGFDPTKHPTFISQAIDISKLNFSENGFIPLIGCTQVFRLAERILALTRRTLEKYYPE